MADLTDFPTLEEHLPELMVFVAELARGYRPGEVDSWAALAERVHAFFTPGMRARVEAVAPGWGEMSAYGGGVTLVHVMCVFMGLLLCPEYQQAAPRQQALLKWAVLFHDIAKKAQSGRRDQMHGFRSAALAGQSLPGLGFPLVGGNREQLDAWAGLTATAAAWDERGEAIQDNRRLPEIMAGLEALFGRDTPAALVLKTVLLHISLTVVRAWPQTAPLTEAEIKQYIDGPLLPLLKVMMLVDSDGWMLFDQPAREAYRQEIVAAFEAVAQLRGDWR
jgi:hypothetical protein